MNPEMDEERVLAQLERRLAQDDPTLAATMTALNQQFPDEPEEASGDGHEEDVTGEEGASEEEKQRNRWLTVATVFVIIAFLGLFITAVLNSNPQQPEKDPAPPKGLAPAASAHAQRRYPTGTAPRRRCPGPGPTDTPTAYPRGNPCARAPTPPTPSG